MTATPELLQQIFAEAVTACDAGVLVGRALSLEGRTIATREASVEVPAGGRVVVVGAGKAAAPMAAAVEAAVGDLCAGGVVVTKHGHGGPTRRVRVREAAHPVPDAHGLEAAEEIMQVVGGLDPDHVLCVVLSGGASALLPLPAPGLDLADVQATTTALLAAGAPITEVNTVRRHLSAVAGGRLLAATRARALVLVLSDVIGDDLGAVGSGPCAADPTTFADALEVAARRRVALPAAVRGHLEAGAAGAREETLKPGDPRLDRAVHAVVGSFAHLAAAAGRAARRHGLQAAPLAPPQTGDVGALATIYATRARTAPAGRLLIGGGEPTVTLPTAPGRGGRSQHLALLLARTLAGSDRVFLAAGSDGTDGPTDAAGAVVTGDSWGAAEAAGLDPAAALARHDSYAVHAALGTHVRTGPTGTNLLDLHLLAT